MTEASKNIQIMQEAMSMQYMNKCTKRCPHCKFGVSKIDGCNHMTCAQCSGHFCWVCLSKIVGYDHFQENPKCGLFAEIEMQKALNDDELLSQIDIENNLEEVYKKHIEGFLKDANADFCLCPTCQAFNIRPPNRRNDIECGKCKEHFCYICNESMDASDPKYLKHYDTNDCYY